MTTAEFDVDTALSGTGDGTYGAVLTPRWNIADIANGGYVLALACRALARALDREDPLTVTGHFLSPAVAGPATVEVEPLRAGRSVASGQARVLQDGRERVRVLGAFGTLGSEGGRLTRSGDGPPDLPPPDECPTGGAVGPDGTVAPISERFDLRFHPDSLAWSRGEPSGRAEVTGWIRLRDGRDPDTALLPLVVDVFPPTAFELGYAGWVPTVELTVHVRGRPAPGWLRCRTRSRVVGSELIEEDAEVWDARGALVAMSRQLARLPRPGQP